MDALLHLDLPTLVRGAGYLGVSLIVFAETGFFFGFVLPGDSLLFTAGLAASAGYLKIWPLFGVVLLATVLGDNLGYWFGRKYGPRVFAREESFFFKRRYVAETERYFAKYGPRTIIVARFIPFVRSFAPLMAGVGAMPRSLFFRYNVLGGVLWSGLFLFGSYLLGHVFPNIEEYLTFIVAGIVLASVSPVALELWRSRRARA